MRPKIIFATMLTLWSMGKGYGGPAFTQTVKKYIDEGWEVYLLSDEPSNKDYPELDSAHNIQLAASCFRPYTNVSKIGRVFNVLNNTVFTRRLYRAVRPLLSDAPESTVLYAYEAPPVKALRKLATELGAPLVTRFQGTVVTYHLDMPLAHFRLHPQMQALETPADLMIMTDDGTFGERTIRTLGNQSPVRFWKNGLELLEREVSAMKSAFDRDAFRAALGMSRGETMYLTVSRLAGWKKVERAIEGLAESLKTASNGKLVIVGDGDARPALESLADSLGVAERVTFVGAVPHDAVYEYMMACDVFVSLYDLSNVGNPLLEAMTLGRCIVTLDVGDTKNNIHDGETGILMTYDTLPKLGEVFARLAGDPAERARLGNAAAQYARESFWTWKARMDAEFQDVSALLKKN